MVGEASFRQLKLMVIESHRARYCVYDKRKRQNFGQAFWNLRVHIGKENTVPFPVIEVKLSAADQQQLLENFEITNKM
ncbi:MAG: hypothetical protein WCE64_02050 [Bacteroidales bacterium]